MDNKVGRNDPCPCGSGKKYKQCCMLKKEEPKKTYTPAGKRKFTATVIQSSGKTSSIFQATPAPQTTAEVSPYHFLKFKITSTDYQMAPQIPELPFAFQTSDSTTPFAQPATSEALPLPEEYIATELDYRVHNLT